MSLLATVNAANAQQSYFIENIGGNGDQPNNPVPCIKTGDAFGAIRIADASGGMVLVGGGIGGAPLISGLRGGYNDTTNGSQVRLGSSVTSFQNIVLTDGITTVNGTLNVPGAGDIVVGDDISLGGDLNFTNGLSAGASISGYYSANTPALNCPDGADTAIPAVAGLTSGWHIVSCSTAVGGQTEQQVSDMVFRTAGGLYTFGGSLRTPAGTGSFGFKVTADRTGLVLSNSTGAAQNGVTVNFTKILNVA
jgi:hypothetical protein